MNEIFGSITTVAMAIVGLAIIAVLVSSRAKTGEVITAASSGFSQAIQSATGPVTGQNPSVGGWGGLGGIPSGNFY